MPVAILWTDLRSPEFEQSFLRFSWGTRASWSSTSWRLQLAVVRDGRPIGIQDLSATDFAVRRAVVTGSWLGLRHQRQGVGTEMRAGVLALAFEGLGAIVAESGALEGNVSSMRVSRKLGYRPNGEGVIAPRGVPVTQHRFILRREDWRLDLYPVVIENLDACLPMFGVG